MGLRPVPMDTAELRDVIADVSATVRERDSFGGFVEYDALGGEPCPECKGAETREACPACNGSGERELPEGKEFWVRAGYRVGNSEGQGGFRVVGDVDNEKQRGGVVMVPREALARVVAELWRIHDEFAEEVYGAGIDENASRQEIDRLVEALGVPNLERE